jgi:hypothetical protein
MNNNFDGQRAYEFIKKIKEYFDRSSPEEPDEEQE